MLSDATQKIVLSMFSVEYEDIQQLYDDNDSYEEIETKLLPHVKEHLAFNELGDIQLSLRDKCQKYIQENRKIVVIFWAEDDKEHPAPNNIVTFLRLVFLLLLK